MSIEAMQQALNALEYHTMQTRPIHHTDKAIEALRQAIEQAGKQEPVAYIDHVSGKPKFINGYVVQTDYDIPLYTAPPRKPWVGLNWDDMPETYAGDKSFLNIARWAEARLRSKNGY